MSAALQRVVVRMLHDPAFADTVYAGQAVPGLSAAEQAMLRRVDPRAWRTDPWRRGRVITALLEEFPAAAALATRQGGLRGLDAFLSSEAFHACVMDRGSLALAFQAWLVPQAGGVAVLEGAIALARREGPRTPGERLQRAPGLVPLGLPEGTVARWQALRARLGGAPLEALVTGVDLHGLPEEGEGREWVLVEVRGGQAGLSVIGEALARLLLAAEEPTTRAALERAAADLGAGEEAAEVVEGLVGDGSLVGVG